MTVVTRPAHLSEGNDGCGIWGLDVAVGDGTRDQVDRISKDWTNPTEVRVSNGNPEITVKRQALDRYVNIYRMPFLNSVRSIVPNRARLPTHYFRFYLTDTGGNDDIGQVPLEVGESRMLQILLSIKHEQLAECDNKHLLSYYLKITRAAEGETLGFVEQTADSYSGSGQSGDAPPEQDNRAPTVASSIPDATITDEFGWKIVPLSGVFTDADGDLLTLEATFSDFEVAFGYVQYAEGPELVILASQRGTSNITVTANDERGGTVSDTFTVTVKAWPAVASPIADISSLAAGASQQISLSGVFSDADGDALTYKVSSSDNAVATVSKVTDGTTNAVTGLTVAGIAEGSATITVTAQDSDGNEVSDSFDVTVPAPPNQAPTVASAIADATIVNTSGTHRVALPGVFTDADQDSLTITAKSSHTAIATVSVATDHTSLTVTAKSRGTATITVTASDGADEISDTFTVKVKAAPTVASAVADITGLNIGDTRTPSLSGVFSDADGDAIVVTQVQSSDASKVSVFSSLATAADGSISITGFTLTAEDSGTAAITVTAQDSDGNTVSDTFDVTVEEAQQQQVNNAPTVASAISDVTIVNESGTHEVSLSGVFTDADSDTLTITAESSSVSVATVSVASDQSKVTVSAQGRGTATITVTANDGNGGTVSDKFDVKVKSAPVVAASLVDVEMKALSDLGVDVSGIFSDADGDTLTITADNTDFEVVNVFPPFHGSPLTVIAIKKGTDTITVTAEDSDGNTVSDSFVVTVIDPPGAVINLDLSATQDSVNVSWKAPTDGGAVGGYIVRISRKGGGGDGAVKRPGSDRTAVRFNGLNSGTTYEVWVRAQNADGKGDRVYAEITLPEVLPEVLPGSVANLTVAVADSGTSNVKVSWSAPETGGAPDNYIVHIKPADGGKGKTKTPKARKTSVTFKNLEAGTAYEVWVRAENEAGKGERVHASITLPEAEPPPEESQGDGQQ